MTIYSLYIILYAMSTCAPSSARYNNKREHNIGTSNDARRSLVGGEPTPRGHPTPTPDVRPTCWRRSGVAVVGLTKPERPDGPHPVQMFLRLAGARTVPGKRPGDSTPVQMFNRLTDAKTETRAFQRTHVYPLSALCLWVYKESSLAPTLQSSSDCARSSCS